MFEEREYQIREATADDWKAAISLAWKTYLQFEAGDYPTEGTTSFFDFITDETLFKMFLKGEYRMMVALIDDTIVGMISLRNKAHISLLFVDREYHRKGIGKALIEELAHLTAPDNPYGKLTVNAAPYGRDFYHKVGFRDIGEQTETDGIIYTPMELTI